MAVDCSILVREGRDRGGGKMRSAWVPGIMVRESDRDAVFRSRMKKGNVWYTAR
ncbi:hypothetical protein OOK60_03005 [Trichothermofontia sichuanensis B231]|uniref:hypothetical protein n=1 Tax=Trichothermofontia sichuanensis TaxID=3045816 RepID=UPI002247C92B|nr:hypothetical protein [Trichothermofontia sichuanensis]UZQ55063.1 hypothetical protein OOK60_03005 [Trichothermofontia sichuanensis B231]